MSQRMFYQSHSCEGFNARVTIEWNIPQTVDETVIAHRIAGAEDIADSILEFAGSKMRDMVQTMRGYPPCPECAANGLCARHAHQSPQENADG